MFNIWIRKQFNVEIPYLIIIFVAVVIAEWKFFYNKVKQIIDGINH